ncbi:MAG: hypothetical protein AVDCRST_MAG14-1816 [uncultured Rubrobacteraceae bacterium]|uniref:PD-(D/E)XK nuclease superfamily protein n=1 Tax=uncultured Rubrobacteraceae bacterium TaxID=349277 RepID=A0A6J4QWT4_9ACTN|nr:MAG: hypothetical protein AVDCRST_MAG14-1816 [uncultured Rubrobacteraceae bacterium]
MPGRIERPQTFMEIAGYPHYENVCSNFLRFFFDPEGPHGLGSLFLDALLNSVNIAGGVEGFGGNVSVEREVVTEAGNRIDLLIKSDSHALLIENKIFAAIANPFEDYAVYLDSLKNESGVGYDKKTKILLTLYPSREGAEWDFVNLIYADFASAVRSKLGHHVSKADTRYLTLMLDFLNTLESLEEGTRMNQEFVKLLGKREGEVEEFLTALSEFRSELREKVKQLGALIDVDRPGQVEQIPWRPNASPIHFLQHRVYANLYVDHDSYVVVDTSISPKGWEIRIFYRGTPDLSNLEEAHEEFKVPFERNGHFIYHERFDYDEDLNLVAPVVQGIVETISDSLPEPPDC